MIIHKIQSEREIDEIVEVCLDLGQQPTFIAVMPNGQTFFHYDVSSHTGQAGDACCFDLLSEVGEAFQPQFEQALADNGLQLGIIDTPELYCNCVEI